MVVGLGMYVYDMYMICVFLYFFIDTQKVDFIHLYTTVDRD